MKGIDVVVLGMVGTEVDAIGANDGVIVDVTLVGASEVGTSVDFEIVTEVAVGKAVVVC
jgi:hypothetical protein